MCRRGNSIGSGGEFGVVDRHRIQVILHSYLYQRQNAIFRRKGATAYVVAYIKPDILTQAIDYSRSVKKFSDIDSDKFVTTEFFKTKDDAVSLLKDNPHSTILWRGSPHFQLMY